MTDWPIKELIHVADSNDTIGGDAVVWLEELGRADDRNIVVVEVANMSGEKFIGSGYGVVTVVDDDSR